MRSKREASKEALFFISACKSTLNMYTMYSREMKGSLTATTWAPFARAALRSRLASCRDRRKSFMLFSKVKREVKRDF